MSDIGFTGKSHLTLVALIGEDKGFFHQLRRLLSQVRRDPVDETLRIDCSYHHLGYPVYLDDIIGNSDCPDGPGIGFDAFYPLVSRIATFSLPNFRTFLIWAWPGRGPLPGIESKESGLLNHLTAFPALRKYSTVWLNPSAISILGVHPRSRIALLLSKLIL